MVTRDFLKLHGVNLINQGYVVVPIQPGKKAPGFDGWGKASGTVAEVHGWLGNGFKDHGVGILTAITCAIDIDCRDEDGALFFERWCVEHIGKAPVRIGKAPKRLLLYRTSEPFSKRSSNAYLDEWSEKQQIEILGKGQQFVAFHIHPETHEPYVWVDGVSPLNVRAADLVELTGENIEVLIAEFEVYAHKQGWTLAKKGRAAPKAVADTDNPWIEDSAPVELSDEELRTRLMMVPGAEDHDTWFKVGMALYHQFDGGQVGLDLWTEWSETADNFDRDALERRWKSFAIEGKKKAPLTARFILRLSKEAVSKNATELSVRIGDSFINAKTFQEWEAACQVVRRAEINAVQRSMMWSVAKDSLQRIEHKTTHLVVIKRALAYEPDKNDKMPSWAKKWAYDSATDRFIHMEYKFTCTKQGFDATNDRYALTKKDLLDGNRSPSQSASEIALNVHTVPIVVGQRYMPGYDTIFEDTGGMYANTYREPEIAEPESPLPPRDVRNIARVRDHISHLLAQENEQRMFLDWLSWVVQNPGNHVNYAVLLQGVEGDGKSFFAELMRAVMGMGNVNLLNGHTILSSNFSDWAVGQCLVCVEEVRMVSGRNTPDKWEAINKIKPLITNQSIEVHRKGKPTTTERNTSSYLMFSNHKDALPLDDNSRRYLVLFTRWQQQQALLEFREANPHYYKKLYRAIAESAPALRQWLLRHDQAPSFDAQGNAPSTVALRTMIRMSKPEFIVALMVVIEENETLEASDHLVDITGLAHVMMGRGVEWPREKPLVMMLDREGYTYLGRIRVSDERHHFYSKWPEKFQSIDHTGAMATNGELVKNYIRARSDQLSDDL